MIALRLHQGGQGAGEGLDPIKAVAGIVGGVGFLGAGAIIQQRGNVRGLTTAASIWAAAALGAAAGIGAYGLLAGAAVLSWGILVVAGRLERDHMDDEGGSDGDNGSAGSDPD